MIDNDRDETLRRHTEKRFWKVSHPVILQARDFYTRMTYADALYYTYNMQYWCVSMGDKKFWDAVRAEIKVIYSYRRDNT